MLQQFELLGFVEEDNYGFVLNSRNYCCLTINLNYPIALL